MPDSTLTQNESYGGIITPTVWVRPVCMPFTSRLRRQPSCLEASSTRRQVSSPNRSMAPPRIREAAANGTLAASATSFRRGTGEWAIDVDCTLEQPHRQDCPTGRQPRESPVNYFTLPALLFSSPQLW